MILSTRSFFKALFTSILIIALSVTFAYSANVTLQWDANDPTPEGYRVFARETGESYNYDRPLWEDNLTTCMLTGLVEGNTYHFVVRAYDGDLESADSEEVSFTPAFVVPNLAPVADAGQNKSVLENASVILDGSGSNDSDGAITSYRWVQTSGTGISITNATNPKASFIAPLVDIQGDTLTFSLTVTDDDGSTSISSTMVSVLKSSSTDTDGDHVPDILDLFPNDANEWADNDRDGTGNNQDLDDDNDGMPDVWEDAYGLDPFTNDSDLDADGDGLTNLSEFYANTSPVAAPDNNAPDAPVIDTPIQTERVDLTPVLVSGVYFDVDNDDHLQSRWQISAEADFSMLILDEISKTQLTAFTVGEMILDVDTLYYWRVKFIDSRSGESVWSQPSSFTTIAADSSDDKDINGIPDAQEVGESVDVNENGLADCMEGCIMSLNTVEGQAIVGVETISDNVELVSIKSLSTETLVDQSVKMGFGLVGFKLYLQGEATTATVKIHFSKPVANDAQLYKYLTDSGWDVYENAVFAPNRKSVTLVLVDGGIGDEDGVKNGVIVDPSGISYTDPLSSDSTAVSSANADGGGGGGCFISAGTQDFNTPNIFLSNGVMFAVMLMTITAGVIASKACRVNRDK